MKRCPYCQRILPEEDRPAITPEDLRASIVARGQRIFFPDRVTLHTAAEILARKDQTIRNLVSQGHLNAIRCRGRLTFRISDLASMLENSLPE